VLFGCGPNKRIIESGNNNPQANVFEGKVKPAESSFDQDVEAMRTVDFYYIYVFRRKDGETFDPDDKKYLTTFVPSEINRRQISDGGRALITGSNFLFPSEALDRLRERFAFEDLSSKNASTPKMSDTGTPTGN
jgi:hypothetical protein